MPSRVAFFGTYDARSHPRVAVLRDGLRDRGVDVVECNVPIGLSTAERVRLVQQPWRIVPVVLRLLRTWLRLLRLARRVGPVDAVVVGYLGHVDVHLARRAFRGVPVVLDQLVFLADTAADRAIGGAWRDRALGAIDRAAAAAADIILVDTPEHAGLVPARYRDRALVVAVGAPTAWFVAPRPPTQGPLSVVFFGLYTPLQGAPTIGDAIARLAGSPVRFTMVGLGQDRQETERRAAGGAPCTWHDWVDSDDLPALVAEHDVCLGVFGAGPKALRVVPNKVYQGAAAGCALVTSDTAPQRQAVGGAAVLVPPEDPEALASALRELAVDRVRLQELRSAAAERASSFTPAGVVAPLVDRLGL